MDCCAAPLSIFSVVCMTTKPEGPVTTLPHFALHECFMLYQQNEHEQNVRLTDVYITLQRPLVWL